MEIKTRSGKYNKKVCKNIGKIEVNWHIQTIWIQKSLGQVQFMKGLKNIGNSRRCNCYNLLYAVTCTGHIQFINFNCLLLELFAQI